MTLGIGGVGRRLFAVPAAVGGPLLFFRGSGWRVQGFKIKRAPNFGAECRALIGAADLLPCLSGVFGKGVALGVVQGDFVVTGLVSVLSVIEEKLVLSV